MEWSVLLTAVGGSTTAGTKLKADNSWSDNSGSSGNGTGSLPLELRII